MVTLVDQDNRFSSQQVYEVLVVTQWRGVRGRPRREECRVLVVSSDYGRVEDIVDEWACRQPMSSKQPTEGESYYHIAEIKMLSSDIRLVEQDVGSDTKS